LCDALDNFRNSPGDGVPVALWHASFLFKFQPIKKCAFAHCVRSTISVYLRLWKSGSPGPIQYSMQGRRDWTPCPGKIRRG
jgi:hypothetical protein